MDRSVSSFRMLIDIERSEWIDFRKELCKEDKQRFDGLFSVPKLYHHASSNLSNITTIEPIILSLMFNNFKIVHGTRTTSVQVENNSIKDRVFKSVSQAKNQKLKYKLDLTK